MTLFIRRAVAADEPALRALFLRSRRDTFTWQAERAFQLADFDAQTQGELLWLAQDGEAVAGFISLWAPDHFIHHLHVDRLWARQGVGSALLRALPGFPTARFELKCQRLNTAGLAFYRACGFTEVGAGRADEGEYLLLASKQGPSVRPLTR